MPLLVASGQRNVALETHSAAGAADVAGMNEQEFHVFYARTARPLKAYLMSASGGDFALADDLLQEAYFRFLRADFEAADENHQRNYLFRIATNLLRDHHRRRRPEVPDFPEIADRSDRGDRTQLRSDMSGALRAIKPRDRKLLWLAHVEGFSHREIGEVLGLKTDSVRPMLFRARQRLAEVLRAGGFGS
jgi:RNA polymerase sigma-70 factor (ECF subfamily)